MIGFGANFWHLGQRLVTWLATFGNWLGAAFKKFVLFRVAMITMWFTLLFKGFVWFRELLNQLSTGAWTDLVAQLETLDTDYSLWLDSFVEAAEFFNSIVPLKLLILNFVFLLGVEFTLVLVSTLWGMLKLLGEIVPTGG